MIKIAKDSGVIDIRILTNGSLMTEEIGKKLLLSGLTFLSFSIDAATSETYYKVRRSKLFNTVVDNLKRLFENMLLK